MSLIVMVLLIFVAATAVVFAVALLVWDLRKSDEAVDRRLSLTSQDLKLPPELLPATQPSGRIDRAFYQLVEGSGSRLDGQTALVLLAAMAVVGCAVPLVLMENLLAGATGLLLGAALPLLWWTICRLRRFRAMQKILPNTLELLADGIRAGQTLEQAAELVALQGSDPLKQEFSYCVSQLRLGHSPVAVLERLARRIPIPEFRMFATAVLVHRQAGGNLALLAQRLANAARDRSEFLGHTRAVTAGSRLSTVGLTLGTIIAMGILAWLRPEYLEAFINHPLGPSLLLVAAVLQTLGILWVWRIMRVTY